MTYRNNDILYTLFRNGLTLEEFKREQRKVFSSVIGHGCVYNVKNNKKRKNRSKKIENTLKHLLKVVEDYMEEYDMAS